MKFLFIAFLFLASTASAADSYTANIFVTNTPAEDLTFIVNADTRTWKTNATAVSHISRNPAGSNNQNATNLYLNIAATPFTGPLYLSIPQTNQVRLIGGAGQALAITMSNSWGYFTITTNAATVTVPVRIPISAEPTASQRTNIASGVVSGVNSYATNRFIVGVLPVGMVTGWVSQVPWLSITGSPVRVVTTNATKIALNTYSDNNMVGGTNFPANVVLTNGNQTISGIKTFTDQVVAKSTVLSSNTVTIVPNTNTYTALSIPMLPVIANSAMHSNIVISSIPANDGGNTTYQNEFRCYDRDGGNSFFGTLKAFTNADNTINPITRWGWRGSNQSTRSWMHVQEGNYIASGTTNFEDYIEVGDHLGFRRMDFSYLTTLGPRTYRTRTFSFGEYNTNFADAWRGSVQFGVQGAGQATPYEGLFNIKMKDTVILEIVDHRTNSAYQTVNFHFGNGFAQGYIPAQYYFLSSSTNERSPVYVSVALSNALQLDNSLSDVKIRLSHESYGATAHTVIDGKMDSSGPFGYGIGLAFYTGSYTGANSFYNSMETLRMWGDGGVSIGNFGGNVGPGSSNLYVTGGATFNKATVVSNIFTVTSNIIIGMNGTLSGGGIWTNSSGASPVITYQNTTLKTSVKEWHSIVVVAGGAGQTAVNPTNTAGAPLFTTIYDVIASPHDNRTTAISGMSTKVLSYGANNTNILLLTTEGATLGALGDTLVFSPNGTTNRVVITGD